jgi:NDP-sugar pyrophosphorylase family protein
MIGITALILAGGKGTRLAGVHGDRPKALLPVAGEPFLHWLITWLRCEGVQDFVFSLGHQGDLIEQWLEEAPVLKDTRWLTFRETEPLGTGGGALACLPLCGDKILVVNGDGLLLSPLKPVIELFDREVMDGVLFGMPVEDASRYGSLVVSKTGRLLAFREKEPGAGLINAGTYLFRKRVLGSFPKNVPLSMEYDVIPEMLREGRYLAVHQVEPETPFIDIGTPESLAHADHFVEKYIVKAA